MTGFRHLTLSGADLVHSGGYGNRTDPDALRIRIRIETGVSIDAGEEWQVGIILPLHRVLLLPAIPHDLKVRYAGGINGGGLIATIIDGVYVHQMGRDPAADLLGRYQVHVPIDAVLALHHHLTALNTAGVPDTPAVLGLVNGLTPEEITDRHHAGTLDETLLRGMLALRL